MLISCSFNIRFVRDFNTVCRLLIFVYSNAKISFREKRVVGFWRDASSLFVFDRHVANVVLPLMKHIVAQ